MQFSKPLRHAIATALLGICACAIQAQQETPEVQEVPLTEPPLSDSCRQPEYPLLAKRFGEAGTVVVALRIGPDGAPIEVFIKVSSGFLRLDAAAQQAAAHCRFAARSGNAIRIGNAPFHFIKSQ